MAYWQPSKVGTTQVVRMVKGNEQFSTTWKAYAVHILKRFGELLTYYDNLDVLICYGG